MNKGGIHQGAVGYISRNFICGRFRLNISLITDQLNSKNCWQRYITFRLTRYLYFVHAVEFEKKGQYFQSRKFPSSGISVGSCVRQKYVQSLDNLVPRE